MTRRLVLALLVLSGTRTVGAEPCPPRAELDGDRDAIASVSAQLRRLGVAVTPAEPSRAAPSPAEPSPAGCRVVRAVVTFDGGGGIAVAVRGPARGSEARVVSDAGLAAAWIDSWAREDMDAALWAAPEAAVEIGPILAPRADLAVETPPARTPVQPRWSASADFARMWSGDGASWIGASVSLSQAVGRVRLGGRARFLVDPERDVGLTAVKRDDLALLATASYPVAVGSVQVAPEAALGVGRIATARVDGTCSPASPMPDMCSPMDPMCVMQPPPAPCDPIADRLDVGDDFAVATVRPRIELALRVSVPVYSFVSLDGFAGASLVPFAHTGAYVSDVPTMTVMPTPSDTALPGEPSLGWQLGLGLRIGGAR